MSSVWDWFGTGLGSIGGWGRFESSFRVLFVFYVGLGILLGSLWKFWCGSRVGIDFGSKVCKNTPREWPCTIVETWIEIHFTTLQGGSLPSYNHRLGAKMKRGEN